MPQVDAEVRQRFESDFAEYKQVQNFFSTQVVPELREQGWVVEYRLKTVESVAEKIETGRFHKWSEIDDIFAATVVVPDATEEKRALVVLKSLLGVPVEERRRETTGFGGSSSFGFNSPRYIFSIPEEWRVKLADSRKSPKFEIQIPTILEWAWLKLTHDFAYKGTDFNSSAFRAASMIKANFEQVEWLLSLQKGSSSELGYKRSERELAKEYVVEQAERLFSDGLLKDVQKPMSMNRFADNIYGLVERITQYEEFERLFSKLVKGGVVDSNADKVRLRKSIERSYGLPAVNKVKDRVKELYGGFIKSVYDGKYDLNSSVSLSPFLIFVNFLSEDKAESGWESEILSQLDYPIAPNSFGSDSRWAAFDFSG